ncbi:MAG: Lar family restriction alleviation protein [Paludibacteraceae bacterium]|nr:Lar family restriction alleviation protein [Paludibacteraceae bacterium]
MTELKRCPFCGGKATIQRAHPWFMLKKYRDKFAFAGCAKCGISTRMLKVPATGSPIMNEHETEVMNHKLAEIWNTRRPDCEHAEHDSAGCLGYSGCTQDDEPIECCKRCKKYTGNRGG